VLTVEEQNIVVEAMKKYPAGVDGNNWGSSDDFSNEYGPSYSLRVMALSDAILLESG